MFSLEGKKALIIGVANDSSIAWGCAKAFKKQGADIALTYLNEKSKPYIEPLANEIDASIFTPLDVSDEKQEQDLFDTIEKEWGTIDIVLHSIAFCPKSDLHGRVIDCSKDGFTQAMDISVHSFLRLIKKFEPIMNKGGTFLTVSFYGSEKVVDHYNIMGPVKAALESATRYAAKELGEKEITAHTLSPGPLATRAASGIDHFDELMNKAAANAPTHMLATIDDVGAYAVFLVSSEARNITGGTHLIDGGFHIIA